MGNPKLNSPSPSIQHFSHTHPLELQVSQQVTTKVTASCAGCKFNVSDKFFVCKPCNYFLHSACSNIAQFINHPVDPNHALTLLPVPAYPDGFFNCDACGRSGNGFSYHCQICNIDIHALCALMPLSINHQSHHHPLTLTFSPPYPTMTFSCDICQQMGSKHWLYRCSSCEYDAHLGCARIKSKAPPQPQTHPIHQQTVQGIPVSQPKTPPQTQPQTRPFYQQTARGTAIPQQQLQIQPQPRPIYQKTVQQTVVAQLPSLTQPQPQPIYQQTVRRTVVAQPTPMSQPQIRPIYQQRMQRPAIPQYQYRPQSRPAYMPSQPVMYAPPRRPAQGSMMQPYTMIQSAGYDNDQNQMHGGAGYDVHEPGQVGFEAHAGYDNDPNQMHGDAGFNDNDPKQMHGGAGYNDNDPNQMHGGAGYDHNDPNQMHGGAGYDHNDPNQMQGGAGYDHNDPNQMQGGAGYDHNDPNQMHGAAGYDDNDPNQMLGGADMSGSYGDGGGYEFSTDASASHDASGADFSEDVSVTYDASGGGCDFSENISVSYEGNN